jgi:hypothetical protein
MSKLKFSFYISLIFILLLILINQAIYYRFKKQVQINKNISVSMETLVQNVENNLNKQHQYEDIFIPDLTIETENDSLIKLKSLLLNGENKLLIHLPNLNCTNCYDSVNVLLYDFINYYSNYILLISTTKTKIDIIEFHKRTKIQIPIYRIPSESFQFFPLPKLNLLYMFILDSQFNVNLFYSPLPEIPKLTSNYLNILSSRYF